MSAVQGVWSAVIRKISMLGCFPLPELHSEPVSYPIPFFMAYENTVKIPNQVSWATFRMEFCIMYKSNPAKLMWIKEALSDLILTFKAMF